MKEKKFCHFCGGPLVRKQAEGRERLYCEACREPLYENPVPASALVVVDPDERVLLVKRSVPPKEGLWCLPGGFMEIGENPEECALRELYEETRLTGRIFDSLGLTVSRSELYHQVLLMGFLVRDYSGTMAPGDDASEAAFFAMDQIPKLAFDSHERFVRIYYAAYQEGL